MAIGWNDQENLICIHLLDEYRKVITGKSDKEVRKITKEFSQKMFYENKILNNRTIQAISEHISYFDDLMAGVKSKEYYALKDEKHFNKMPREDNNKKSNPARVIRNKLGNESASIVWVNIDIPMKKFTIHQTSSCTYITKIQQTPFKGVNLLKRDGGWLSFGNNNESEFFYSDQYPNYQRIDHC